MSVAVSFDIVRDIALGFAEKFRMKKTRSRLPKKQISINNLHRYYGAPQAGRPARKGYQL